MLPEHSTMAASDFTGTIMLSDPMFYAVAIPAVLISSISKGGLGGGLGVLSVPLMSLVIPPTQAAAIMLPILCFIDLFALKSFRGTFDKENLKTLIPAALLGIVIGTLFFNKLSTAHIKLLVGAISIVFAFNWIYQTLFGRSQKVKPAGRVRGLIYGAVAGFTSFNVHAGGPPINMYLLPQKMDKTLFVGTTVIFFTVVNYTKLIPYAFLGLLDFSNLKASLVLMVLAPIGVKIGVWAHHKLRDNWFYWICYVALFITGLKLSYEGISAIIQA